MSSSSSSNDSNAPIMSRLEARMAVKSIKKSVSALIGDSDVMEGSMGERHETYGLFHKQELQLGKLLGSGGFSDVYELKGFAPSEEQDEDFTESQQAVRKYYRDTTTKKSKYVVKHLRPKAAQDIGDFCMAASDLVVESQYLCSLNHKNILNIRAWSAGGIQAYSDGRTDGFFLILDRVCDTLEQRIELWRDQTMALQKRCNAKTLQVVHKHHMRRATRVASQIAGALQYLHSKGIVFRDLKPGNVGFDEDGTVKLFDFGLARELPSSTTAVKKDVYQMSGIIGTQRYMAPEVALSQKYNQKVDTYSWSMLYWSCLTLEKPYAGIDKTTHRSMVCKLGQRPVLKKHIIPSFLQRLLKQSWAQSIPARLTMSDVIQRMARVETRLAATLAVELVVPTATADPQSLNASHTLVSMAA